MIREQGWAFDNAEDSPGIYCIAAPVFNRSREVIAAVSISGVELQMPKDRIPRYSVLVREACRLSRQNWFNSSHLAEPFLVPTSVIHIRYFRLFKTAGSHHGWPQPR